MVRAVLVGAAVPVVVLLTVVWPIWWLARVSLGPPASKTAWATPSKARAVPPRAPVRPPFSWPHGLHADDHLWLQAQLGFTRPLDD